MNPGAHASVLLVDIDGATRTLLQELLRSHGYEVTVAGSASRALETFYANPPQCLIIRYGMAGASSPTLLEDIKSDNVYGHLPTMVILSLGVLGAGIDWHRVAADDYLLEPLQEQDVLSRVQLCLARAQRDVNANPLTGLPGNLTITKEAERRLAAGMTFGFAYLDVDNFKSYNDKYGFSRGDEVLRMTARVIVNAMRSLSSDETYVGHVGGDDFVFIAPCAMMPQACGQITRNFDLIVRDFYDHEDREKGCIESVDRQGNARTFPLMSVSIGVVDTSATPAKHMRDIVERVTEVKSFTKRLPGSNFIIDRRRG